MLAAAPGWVFSSSVRVRVQAPDGAVRVRVAPGLHQLSSRERVLRFREVGEHVALLVDVAAVHDGALPEAVADRFAERFRAVDHDQQAMLGAQPAFLNARQQAGDDAAVLGRALADPEQGSRPLVW